MRQVHLWKKKNATFHISLFSFSCHKWLTRNGIMNEEIATKRSLFRMGKTEDLLVTLG